MMIDPDLVAENFSRSAAVYEQYAGLQKYAAGRLAELIYKQISTPKNLRKVLEIGCGTGFLTNKLLQVFPTAAFQITDISQAMLQQCRTGTAPLREKCNINADFTLLDIARQMPHGQYHLVAAALVFQWLPNLQETLLKLRKHLYPGGYIAFSTLGSHTFRDFQLSFREAGIAYPGPRLLEFKAVKTACTVFPQTALTRELVTEEYPDTVSFLRQLRKIGAGNASSLPLSPGQLRRVIRLYDRHRSEKRSLQVEYEIIYVIVQGYD